MNLKPEKMKRVLVLMSTYNGEKYLAEQIDSILQQQGVKVYLLARDDGSHDSTFKILEKYSLQHDNIKCVKGENVGFIHSFSKLVCMAANTDDFDCYAFADQDDIWYPNKLVTAVNALQLDDSKPMLFASNCMLVDSQGNDIRQLRDAALHYRKGNSLYSGSVQGCSMVFNKTAIRLYAKHIPSTTYHDTWMLYVCAIFGKVVYDATPLFAYRIHSNNALGLGHQVHKGFVKKIKEHINGRHSSLFYNSALEFKDKYRNDLDGDNLDVVNNFLNYKKNFASKLKVLYGSQYGSLYDTLKARLAFYKNVIFNNL